jgi:hypothetical protein
MPLWNVSRGFNPVGSQGCPPSWVHQLVSPNGCFQMWFAAVVPQLFSPWYSPRSGPPGVFPRVWPHRGCPTGVVVQAWSPKIGPPMCSRRGIPILCPRNRSANGFPQRLSSNAFPSKWSPNCGPQGVSHLCPLSGVPMSVLFWGSPILSVCIPPQRPELGSPQLIPAVLFSRDGRLVVPLIDPLGVSASGVWQRFPQCCRPSLVPQGFSPRCVHQGVVEEVPKRLTPRVVSKVFLQGGPPVFPTWVSPRGIPTVFPPRFSPIWDPPNEVSQRIPHWFLPGSFPNCVHGVRPIGASGWCLPWVSPKSSPIVVPQGVHHGGPPICSTKCFPPGVFSRGVTAGAFRQGIPQFCCRMGFPQAGFPICVPRSGVSHGLSSNEGPARGSPNGNHGVYAICVLQCMSPRCEPPNRFPLRCAHIVFPVVVSPSCGLPWKVSQCRSTKVS